MGLNVAVEVIRDKIVIAVVFNSIDHGLEVVRASESTLLNLFEDLCQVRVNGVRAVCVGVTKVLNVFGQVAEQEDVVLADLAGDLNLGQWVSSPMQSQVPRSCQPTFAPSHVPMMRPPLSTNFMLLVP